MPRKPRLFVSGGVYHVYCRTHRGEKRFSSKNDADSFIETVAEVSSEHQLTVLGFALMCNHYHLVVRTGDVKLWRSMAAIHARVTRAHNRQHRVLGSGWQSRYRARLIQDDQDLRNLLAYVHLNPVVAGLVDDPADYEMSGHRALIGHTAPILVDVSAALRCFGEETTRAARTSYLRYVRSVASAKWARGTLRQLPWWKQVRDDYQTVEEQSAPPEARTFDDAHPELPPPPEENPEHLVERVCRVLGESPADITGTSRRRSTSVARRRVVFIAVCYFRQRGTAVARVMKKSPCQVSRWLAAETAACSYDPAEAAYIEDVVVELLS
jgi:REP element-mobilizing transposase RayT